MGVFIKGIEWVVGVIVIIVVLGFAVVGACVCLALAKDIPSVRLGNSDDGEPSESRLAGGCDE